MKETCLVNFNEYMSVFENKDEEEKEENTSISYNLLCETNKKNEHRKGRSSFFVNLMIYDIINKDVMYDFLFKLFEKIKNMEPNNKEEFFENISIIVLAGKNKFEEDADKWENIVKEITNISESNITKKMKFKCLDVLDEIED